MPDLRAAPEDHPAEVAKRKLAEAAEAKKRKAEADAARRHFARSKAEREWAAERKFKPAGEESRLPVLDETAEQTLARLSRWSVESESGDLKGLIHQMLTSYEQDLLRGRIAVAVYGKLSQDEFEHLVRTLKASNWPQPSALVKVARHVGVLPAQTRGIKQKPVWLIVKEHTQVTPGADRVTTQRHCLDLMKIIEDQRQIIDGEQFLGKKLACGKVMTESTGRGKNIRQVSHQRLPDGGKVSGTDIFWCAKCWRLYNKQ